jgi:hypothetical protein
MNTIVEVLQVLLTTLLVLWGLIAAFTLGMLFEWQSSERESRIRREMMRNPAEWIDDEPVR